MSDAQFPSGQWFGFYTYAHSPQRFLMDLVLEFAGENLTGEGTDGLGAFAITGTYDAASGECSGRKRYLRGRVATCTGYREGKGIWGTWKIGAMHGGFRIWPLGESEPLAAEATTETVMETAAEETSEPATVELRRPSAG